MLRAAVEVAVHTLAGLDEEAPGAGYAAKRALHTVTALVATMREEWAALMVTGPAGPVTVTMSYLDCAAEHLDAGDIPAGRAAVVTAYSVLARLTPSGDRDGGFEPGWRF